MSYEILRKYLPNDQALEWIKKWIEPYSVQIVISKERKAKLGDYRKLKKTYVHKITINYNLPKDLFFLTLTHEIAHMMVYDKHHFRQVKPHGSEWKSIYSRLILESLNAYPAELQKLLLPFSKNPKASYYGDSKIARYFTLQQQPDQLLLLNLNEGTSFSIENTPYLLLKKNRTRYLCKNMKNQKNYLINHSVSVQKSTINESK